MLSAMKTIDAAYEALREAGEPLRARAIAERSIARGLWKTKGKTPWNTVARDIQADIKENGERSRFLQVAPGTFMLNPAAAESLGASPNAPMSVAAGSVAPATRVTGPMSFLDAAEHILREARRALHYEEIMRRAIDLGLVQPEGQTPAASLNAQIGMDIRQRKARGEPQRFVRPKRGYIGLEKPLSSNLEHHITEHNKNVLAELLKRITSEGASAFEELVANLLEKLGFETIGETTLSNDGGIDVYGDLVIGNVVRIKVGVQAKLWKGNVGREVVQRLRGSLSKRGLAQGIIITISDFSKGARNEAADAIPPIALLNGEDLAGLLVEHRLGAERGETLFRLLDPEADDASP